MIRFVKGLIAATLICVAADAAAQENRTLTPNQVLQLGVELLNAGDPAQAGALATALIQRNPNDVAALILASRAAFALGDPESGRQFARDAYWASDGGGASYVAARLTARGFAEERKDTRAQIWLRRARQFAPDEASSQSVARDYQSLRRRNPWSTTLRFGVTPSSNVNNGSVNRTAQLFGLPFEFELSGDARALSGLEISAGGSARYRLSSTSQSATFFDFDANGRTYILSNEAQVQAPDAKGSDFSEASLGFGITHRSILAEGMLPLSAALRFGQTWYGGEAYTRSVDVNASQAFRLAERDQITVALAAQERRGLDGQETVWTYRATGSWRRVLGNNDIVGMSLTGQRALSDDVNSDFESWRVGASYDFSQSFQGLQFGLGLDFERRDFDGSTFAPGPRQDDIVTARLSILANNIEYYGFQPVVLVQASQNRSNVNLFDRDYFRVGFDLRSAF